MRLFMSKGFENTTLDDIAAGADVSRRTLLNYFGSKEEIVFSLKAGYPQMVADAVSARPADEPLMTMVENAFSDLARQHQTPDLVALTRLIHETPSLKAGDQAKYERLERMLAEALASRKGLDRDDLACAVVAGAAVSIMKLSRQAWLNRPSTDALAFSRRAFAALRQAAAPQT